MRREAIRAVISKKAWKAVVEAPKCTCKQTPKATMA